MHHKLMVTVSSDRDPSVNPYTLTETFEYPGADRPTVESVRNHCEDTMTRFRESWPFPRLTQPVRLNVDADLRMYAGRSPGGG